MKWVIASNNAHKIVELREILSGFGLEVLSQAEAGLHFEAEETGKTFAENAFLKAKAACDASGMPAIADDSGLVVDALDSAPGVYSARYGGEGLDDVGRYELLLKNMENTEHRTARFVSSIACVFPNGDVVRGEGSCEGVILYAPRGSGGFGYDPVFLFPELGLTMAEITPELKNRISHRAHALQQFRLALQAYLDQAK